MCAWRPFLVSSADTDTEADKPTNNFGVVIFTSDDSL